MKLSTERALPSLWWQISSFNNHIALTSKNTQDYPSSYRTQCGLSVKTYFNFFTCSFHLQLPLKNKYSSANIKTHTHKHTHTHAFFHLKKYFRQYPVTLFIYSSTSSDQKLAEGKESISNDSQFLGRDINNPKDSSI